MLSKLTRSALDLLFPIYCAGCGREGGIICRYCADDLKQLSPPYCRVCAAPGVDGVCRWCLEYPRGFESCGLHIDLRDLFARLFTRSNTGECGPRRKLWAN